jgi:hypothetical protein
MKKALLPLLLLAATPLFAAEHVVDRKTFDAIATELSGERAQQDIRRIVEYHRVQGSPMMTESAERVVLAGLKSAGVESQIEQFPSDGATRYQSWISPIGWSIKEGELWVEGDTPVRLCRYSDVAMCVTTYSKGGEWSGELVDVGVGSSASDYANVDVRGKVVLAYGYASGVVREGVIARDAVGAVIYPRADDRSDHPDMVRYNGLWTRADELEKTSGSFQISANQYAMLKTRMRRGPVRVRGKIDATLGPGQLTLVHAWIRGSEAADEEVLVTAHLDHPKWSANDNASGSAAMVEIARTLQTLIAANKLPRPRRTIHFMWIPEWYGTVAWLTKHPEARGCDANWVDSRDGSTIAQKRQRVPCIVANLNLDMVGEDTAKTGGRFYMTRSPLSVPSFLDALLPDLLEQTRDAGLVAPTGTRHYWGAEMVDYFQGSDHDMLLGIGVPATMFGHDPDWTHHTSEDTADKTDASELRRVGVLAAAASYWIAAAGSEQWDRLAPLVVAEKLRVQSQRMIALRRANQTRLASELQKSFEYDAKRFANAGLSSYGTLVEPMATTPPARGPRRIVLTPISGDALTGLSEEHRKWRDAQRSFVQPEAGLELVLFEAMQFMNGRRSSAEIADLLTIEYGKPFTAQWVDQAAAMLASMKLVEVAAR